MRAIAILCLLAGLAQADEITARKHFQAGAKAYAAQNFAMAAVHFDQAYKEAPVPEIAFSAAQAYRRLYRVDSKPSHVRRAAELYKTYLASVKTGGRVADASDNLAEMERELDKIESKTGKVREEAQVERTRISLNIIKADEVTASAETLREIGEGTGNTLAGVTATLDGKPIEPFAVLEVPAGEHVVAVSAEGYFPVEKKQRVVDGTTALVDIELQPKPARVTVKTERGARISVDGRPAASALLELAAGKHVIGVTRRGRLAVGRELAVGRGQEVTIDMPLEKTGRRKAVPWVLGGAGGLALISTIATISAAVADGNAIEARDQIARGNASPALGDEFDRQVKRRDDLKTTAIVFGAGALVAGAVGFGLYLFDSPGSEGLRVTPLATPTSAGVTIGSRF